MRFSPLHLLALVVPATCVFVVSAGLANASPQRSVLSVRDDFNRHSMTRPEAPSASSSVFTGSEARASGASFSLEQPSRFSMHQSYSLTAMSGAQGSASSGLYLNTLSYQLTPLMSAFVDVGFHTPIHSSFPGMEQARGGMGSVVLPRMGLEYRPNDRLQFNFEMVNGPDAWKTWGGSPHGSSAFRTFPGSRIP